MSTPEKHPPLRAQITPLLVYALFLCGIYGIYAFGSRYELFMQSLSTLWPIVAFTLLLTVVIINALLLARGIRLWLLCGLHMLLMCAWLAALQIAIVKSCQQYDDGHICAIIPPWLILILLAFSTLPSWLGYGLLQLRNWQLQKARKAAAADELSFLSAEDILDDSDSDEPDEDTAEPANGNDAGKN